MTIYDQIRQIQSTTQYLSVAITEVNPDKYYVIAEDQYNTPIQISLDLHGDVATMPAVGEIWRILKDGTYWRLDQRQEVGDERISIPEMKAGDKRLEARNNLHLAAEDVIIHGILDGTIIKSNNYSTAIKVVKADYNITEEDGVILGDAIDNSFKINLPTAKAIDGRFYSIKKINAGNIITIFPFLEQTIDGVSSKNLTSINSSLILISDGANWKILGGSASSVSSADFVYNEIPGGLINGSNTIYTLVNSFATESYQVSLNGLIQKPINDYTTISDNQINFINPPKSGSTILVTYHKA